MEPVEEPFFESAPHRWVHTIDLDVTPDRVWQSLQSDDSVAAWGPTIKWVRWTSPRPFGIGTTRDTAAFGGRPVFTDRFFIWDEGQRYAFSSIRGPRLLRRFAEDYVVTAHNGGARLTWTVALEPTAHYRAVLTMLSPVIRIGMSRLAAGARQYFAQHP
jgi:polyketide cyclase/dehydrase/lipid transport protein